MAAPPLLPGDCLSLPAPLRREQEPLRRAASDGPRLRRRGMRKRVSQLETVLGQT